MQLYRMYNPSDELETGCKPGKNVSGGKLKARD
jgi:hypothetical protein